MDILVNWFTSNGRTVDNVHRIYHFDRLLDFHTKENKTLVINNDARLAEILYPAAFGHSLQKIVMCSSSDTL